jgi:CheY-like chemotaxis protein
MPKMNGFELCNEMRKVNDKVKVCFVTAFDIQREEEDDLKAVGTLNEKPVIIRKPITVEDVFGKKYTKLVPVFLIILAPKFLAIAAIVLIKIE